MNIHFPKAAKRIIRSFFIVSYGATKYKFIITGRHNSMPDRLICELKREDTNLGAIYFDEVLF